MKKIIFIMLLATGSCLASPSLISYYRCGTSFVTVGMTLKQVKKLCVAGSQWAPTKIEKYTQQVAVVSKHNKTHLPVITIDYQKWYFKRYGEFPTTITFKNGVVWKMVTRD